MSLPRAEPSGTPHPGLGPPRAGSCPRCRGSARREPGAVRGAGARPAGSCPRCWGSAGAQALRGCLSAPDRTSRRGCARGAPARGSAEGGGRGRGWLTPGQRGDAATPILPAAVRAEPASAPKLVGNSPREIARDCPAPGLEEGRCRADNASRHGAVPGLGTPSYACSALRQDQSLFRDQLVPSRAAPTD